MRWAFALIFSLLSWQAFSEVKQFTLPNGLKLIVKEDHRSPVAVTMLWYNVGSADEPGGITGVSHALEHMMFKGTSKYPLGTYSKTIASLGGQENAFTNYDYTAYYQKMASSHLPISFELEADRMQNLLLDKNEFAKEINVIKEERRLRTDDNPQALTYERYMAAAHLTEPYHHPIVGWMSDIKNLRVADLKSWYQNFYTPNNATLVVVGDVDADKVHDLAKLYFGNIPRRADFMRKEQIEPPRLGEKKVNVHAPANVPLIVFGYPVPSVKTAKEDWEPYALEVITGILNAGESARFAKNLMHNNQIASDAEAHYELYTRYPTQFVFFGAPATNHTVADLKTAMLNEIRHLQTEQVSEEELKRVKTQIIAQKTYEKDSLLGQAMELGLLNTLDLDAKLAADYQDKIQAVTPQQIQTVAKRYFITNAMTEAQLFPQPYAKEQR